ncbi:S24 family peptidase [Oecophyllibacter saccharovorans]|uniref:S24 family peptidase n=1 Tax=Oecophyllibacter saccharovorans TaxID=2558360 RepID=UPI00116ED37A|nr:S24 family peptidase [Oecophyllibacter saccharovorans]TPW36610.1 S24 family peptidase [Oecophyllibacter saccharovorans]
MPQPTPASPDNAVRARQKAWIDAIRQASGHSYSRIARECGLAQTTVSRFMDDGQTTGALSARTEARISQRYGDPQAPAPHAPALPTTDAQTLSIPEYDVAASAGDGLMVPEMQHPSRYWTLPLEALHGIRASALGKLAILTVAGDSMLPDYAPGEKILVDTGDRRITHDGAFVLWNGAGLVVKMVQVIPGPRGTRRLRIISKNADYPPYELPPEDVVVSGRVAGKWVWK